MVNKEGEDYKPTQSSGMRYTGFLTTRDGTPLDNGLAEGHNGYLFTGLSSSRQENTPEDLTRRAGSTTSLFEKTLFD